MSNARHVDKGKSSALLDKSRLKQKPVFVFDDFETREHKFIHSNKKERVYVLTLKNTGGLCRVLHVKRSKEFLSRILFETFSDIHPDETIEIQILADESTRIGIHEFSLSLSFLDSAKNVFLSKFTLENSEFAISNPVCIRRMGFIPKLLHLLSRS